MREEEAGMEFRNDARPSPIAGTWYKGDPKTLAAEIDQFLESAKVSADEYEGKLLGLVAPHAGHRYSGRTAGYSYKLAQSSPRGLAVILSPFHPYSPADFLTTAHHAYQTPLGDVPVAQELLLLLDGRMRQAGLALTQIAQDEEHSIEIQLPFLQRAWQEEFSLLPVMVRTHDAQKLGEFAQALHESLEDQDYLLIASTDLSHFYPQDYAEVLDAEMLKRIKEMDAQGVLDAEGEGSGSACGAGGVAAMLWTAQRAGAERAYILNYSSSADDTGDLSSVVGYGAAAVFRKG
jgi:hypothetical protein